MGTLAPPHTDGLGTKGEMAECNGNQQTNAKTALAGVAPGLSIGLRTKGSRVQFPGGAHAWAAGWVSGMGHERGKLTLMFLSLSFSHPLSKKTIKKIKKTCGVGWRDGEKRHTTVVQ